MTYLLLGLNRVKEFQKQLELAAESQQQMIHPYL